MTNLQLHNNWVIKGQKKFGGALFKPQIQNQEDMRPRKYKQQKSI